MAAERDLWSDVWHLKATFAGVAGAVAWEVAVRIGVFMDLPLFDLVRELGMLILGAYARWWEWWPAGMAMHAVGRDLGGLYAYFFWSLYHLRPALQGIVFRYCRPSLRA